MSLETVLDAALEVWLAAGILYQAAAWTALWRLLRTRSGNAPEPPPTCTILRSLHRASPRIEANLDALAGLGVPVAVSAEDEGGPAAAIARRVAARYPGARLALRTGLAPGGANRKVAHLLRLLPDARGEVVIFTDADVATPPGYLEAVLAPFRDPEIGLVTCPYRSVGGDSAPERLDLLLTNTGFLPSVALAERLEGARFALGATIAVRRRLLEEIGGLEPLLDLLADDYALAERVRRAGGGIALAPILLDHHIDDVRWRDLWRRHLRWARTMRLLRPGGYAGTIVAHGFIPALGIALSGSEGALAALAGWILLRAGPAALLRRRLGLTLGDLALLPLADLAAFGFFLAGWTGRTVEWGGLRLRVGRDGRMRSEGAAAGPAALPSTPLDAPGAGDAAPSG